MRKPPSARAGFTLIEVIVALGLFALIAMAGFALLRGVLDAQARTEARLTRLSEVQRALFVVADDLDQLIGGLQGGPTTLTFQKRDAAGTPYLVTYALLDGVLTRGVAGGQGQSSQPLLRGVGGVEWSYRLRGLGWAPVTVQAPPAASLPLATADVAAADGSALPAPPTVRAVAVTLTVTTVERRNVQVRRVMLVPEAAQ